MLRQFYKYLKLKRRFFIVNKISKQLIKIASEISILNKDNNGVFKRYNNDVEQKMVDLTHKEGEKYILHHKEGKLWRIQACKNFGNIKKYDFGGLIQSEKNLSQDGNCWVAYDAKVYGNAYVCDDALIFGTSVVSGNSKIYNEAWICENSVVQENSKVYQKAIVCGNAQIYDNAQICGKAIIQGNSQVYQKAIVCGKAVVCGNSKIHGKAKVDYDVKDKEITK